MNTQYGHFGGKWQEGLAPSEELGKRSLDRIIQTETWRISTRWEKPFKAEETKGLKLRIEKEQSRFKSGEFWEKVNICICVTSLIVGKETPCNAGDPSSIPGSGRSTGEGIGYPIQYSWASLVAQLVKNLPAMWERPEFDPWIGKIPWRREISRLEGSLQVGKSLPGRGNQGLKLRTEKEQSRFKRGEFWKRVDICVSQSVQSLSRVQLFAAPWTAAHQASLTITNSQSLLKLMSIELVMPSNHLILYRPLLLPSSIFPSIRVLSNESVLHNKWSKYWSFSFRISPSNEYSGLISFRIDWLDLLAVQGTLKSFLQHYSSKASVLQRSDFFIVHLSHPYVTTGKTITLTRWTFVGEVMSLLFSMLCRLVIAFLSRKPRYTYMYNWFTLLYSKN